MVILNTTLYSHEVCNSFVFVGLAKAYAPQLHRGTLVTIPSLLLDSFLVKAQPRS